MLNQLLQQVQRQRRRRRSGRTETGSANAKDRTLRFGQYAFDLETGELRRDGSRVELRPQATAALQALLRRPTRLVTHDELRQAIWGSTTVAWDTGLHQVIRQLRRGLEDNPGHPTYIETVPRRGYLFRVEPTRPQSVSGHRSTSRGRDALLVLGGSVALPVVVVLFCVLVGLG